MRYKILVVVTITAFAVSRARAQKWLPGHFTDVKGNTETGFIRINPTARGPIPNEGYIEFKADNKTNPFKLSVSDLRTFVAGKDSFVVAHAPGNETWGKKDYDFVKVVLNEDVKLYATASGGKGGGGHGIGFEPGLGAGVGTGGFGGGFGGGLSIPIGGGGGGSEKTIWYYGANTAEMKRLTDENFEDVMTDIMGDDPEVVQKIHAKVYVLANIDRLITYFKQVAKK